MSNLTALKSALESKDGEGIRYALSAYLKEDVRSTSALLKPEPIDESCGHDGVNAVEAEVCASVITDCISGNDVPKCVNTLYNVKDKLKNGIKGMNSQLAFKVCKNLGIDILNLDGKNAKEKWIATLNSGDQAQKDAAELIAKNTPLMYIIDSFIVAAKNPLVDSNSVDFTQRRIELTATIKPRTPRMLVKVQSGGGMARSGFNKYVQYADSLKTVVSMRGGAEQPILNKTYDELANIYNNFVNSLRAKGKQIDSADNERIRQLLSELKYTEEKLSKIVQYIAKYNEIKNHPSFKDDLERSPVTVDLLESLNQKYETEKNKQKKKVFNFLSISDALHKAVSDVDEIKNDISALKGRFGAAPAPVAAVPAPPTGLVPNPRGGPYGPLAAAPPAGTPSPSPAAATPVPAASGFFGTTDFRQANAARQAANAAAANASALEWDRAAGLAARNAGQASAKKYFNW